MMANEPKEMPRKVDRPNDHNASNPMPDEKN